MGYEIRIDPPAKAQRRQEKKSKREIRNPKQIQMIQTLQIQNEPQSNSKFWIFQVLFGLRFVSDFVLGISDFITEV